MAYYDYNGTEIATAYTYAGDAVSEAHESYSTFSDAVRFAYNSATASNNAAFCLISDEHNYLGSATTVFTDLSSYADWSKLLMINIGDDALSISYDEIQADTISALDGRKAALSSVPANRQIMLAGNHDLWWKDSSGTTYLANPALDDNKWVLEKYYPNTGCTTLYGNDVVFYDSAKNIKYISVSGWDGDADLGGYSHYNMNQAHMDAIITELQKADGYDIVILSHVQPFQTQNGWTKPPVEDGSQGGGGVFSTTATYQAVVSSPASVDGMIKARNSHTAGTATDSYGNSHAYDFSGCTGKILCCLAGHEHIDAYTTQDGIPVCLFDAMRWDNHPIFFGCIDKAGNQLNLWKVDDSPMVYNYQIPLTV